MKNEIGPPPATLFYKKFFVYSDEISVVYGVRGAEGGGSELTSPDTARAHDWGHSHQQQVPVRYPTHNQPHGTSTIPTPAARVAGCF